MEAAIKTKFDIGQIVHFKNSANTVMIIGILAEFCSGGVQYHYMGRSWVNNRVDGCDYPAKDVVRYHETELVAEEEISAEVKELIKKKDKLAIMKEEAIKAQDFEKAADFRTEERVVSEELSKRGFKLNRY